MKARDVMVAPVITVKPYSTVKEVAKTLVDRRISAVPVVDNAGKLVGIVSEGDLMHRAETGTERRYRWWIRLMGGDASLPADYIKAHGCKAADIMTQNVITVAPETPLDEIAVMLERNSIKRVPIVARMPPFKRASVDEYVLAAACGLNEPIAALTISPCQCS